MGVDGRDGGGPPGDLGSSLEQPSAPLPSKLSHVYVIARSQPLALKRELLWATTSTERSGHPVSLAKRVRSESVRLAQPVTHRSRPAMKTRGLMSSEGANGPIGRSVPGSIKDEGHRAHAHGSCIRRDWPLAAHRRCGRKGEISHAPLHVIANQKGRRILRESKLASHTEEHEKARAWIVRIELGRGVRAHRIDHCDRATCSDRRACRKLEADSGVGAEIEATHINRDGAGRVAQNDCVCPGHDFKADAIERLADADTRAGAAAARIADRAFIEVIAGACIVGVVARAA